MCSVCVCGVFMYVVCMLPVYTCVCMVCVCRCECMYLPVFPCSSLSAIRRLALGPRDIARAVV